MSVIMKLYKLAYLLDLKGLYNEAEEIESVMKSLSERVGITQEEMVSLADYFDEIGMTALADKFDEMAKGAAKKKSKYKTWKGSSEKPPTGAEHKAPKAWFEKMKKDVKKKNPDASDKRISEIVGDIWDNELTDAKREQIYKRHGKTKSPNK